MQLNLGVKRVVGRYCRRAFEALGSDRYSRPSAFDQALDKYLAYPNGFFVEAGAFNGFGRSNTYYLERFRDWKGILIEGIPELYKQCCTERSGSVVVNAALVGDDFPDSHVTMEYAGLMSVVNRRPDARADEHVKRAQDLFPHVTPYTVTVPARTLTSILDESGAKEIDFLSLDVEGSEVSVLRGLDFDKYRPLYLLIETWDTNGVDDVLRGRYEPIERFSEQDVLYMAR